MSANIDIDLKKLPQQLLPLLEKAKKYVKFGYFIFMLFVCIFLVFQINRFATIEPSEDQVDEKLQTVQRPHIDQASLEKIQQLQDQNVQVDSLFKDARDNPFSE